MTGNGDFRARLERRIDELPVLPTVVGQLMTLDQEHNEFFDRVLALIESDPTFAARMLVAANSAASSPRTEITSVRAALTRLGSSGALGMILAVAVSRVFVPRDPWEKSLWRHALQVGSAARALAGSVDERLNVRPDEAFTAGLLHDVGRFVLFGEAPEKLRRIDEGDWDDPMALVEMERSICGITHLDLGKMACDHWGLPSLFGAVALRHHEQDVDPHRGPVDALISLIHFADLAMFPSAMPGTPGYDSASLEIVQAELMPKCPSGLAISADALHGIIGTVTAEVDQTCVALGIG